MTSNDNDGSSGLSRRERPWLLPYNRRLRHLQGITIRNLTLADQPKRPRGKTIDDAAVPSTLKSPAKRLAQRERKLEHSRSSTELKSIKELDGSISHAPAEDQDKPTTLTPQRPAMPRLRRRSTLDWSGASPELRQKKLDNAVSGRLMDSFFSLHVAHVDEPIYISEVTEKAMNPSFRFFDLNTFGPEVTRLEDMTVRVWVKSETMEDYQFLIELSLGLSNLQFIGKALDHFHHQLPPNCILFHLTDGVYTSFVDTPSSYHPPSVPLQAEANTGKGHRILPTSSYDALMRLSTLDDCIQDALSTRDRLEKEINAILQSNKEALDVITQVPGAQQRVLSINSAVTHEERAIKAARKRRDELKARLLSRRESMVEGRKAENKAREYLTSASETLRHSQTSLSRTRDDMHQQRRRICEDLLKIYPIEPIPNRPLAFTVRGLYLPNVEHLDDGPEEVVSAAFGHVAHVVHLLQFYLSHPLPYPIQPFSSTSVVHDPISVMNTGRSFPLFSKGMVRYRYEYGVFLLNKDIEALSEKLGLKVLDIRQTLPNLKYLLYVATAGQGELPARKAGGIRGLLKADPRVTKDGHVNLGPGQDDPPAIIDAVEEVLVRDAEDKAQSDALPMKANGNVKGKQVGRRGLEKRLPSNGRVLGHVT